MSKIEAIENETDLAFALLTWGELKKQADEVASKISDFILGMEKPKTQTVGNVRASLSNGSGSYDYQAALYGLLEAVVANDLALRHEHTETTVDYKSACAEAGIKLDHSSAYYHKQSGPSVSLKLID